MHSTFIEIILYKWLVYQKVNHSIKYKISVNCEDSTTIRILLKANVNTQKDTDVEICNNNSLVFITYTRDIIFGIRLLYLCFIGKKANVSNVRMLDFLPQRKNAFYHYRGSLTTPPCYESVMWFVMADTIPMSERQVNTWIHLYTSLP